MKNPFTFSLWLAMAGLSFGISLGWAWLVLLGLLGPCVVLMIAFVAPFLSR